jgi:hypothetical protein
MYSTLRFLFVPNSSDSSLSDFEDGDTDEIRRILFKKESTSTNHGAVSAGLSTWSDLLTTAVHGSEVAGGIREVGYLPAATPRCGVRGGSLPPQADSLTSIHHAVSPFTSVQVPGVDATPLSGTTTSTGLLPQPTMWIGTEDGAIHIYNCSDNIRIKKNKLKIQHDSPVNSIV